MKTPRAKKPSKTEQIAHLTNLLNLRCSELEQLIQREKDIYFTLGGTPGEHPLERAKRVVSERSELADKVLVKENDRRRAQSDADRHLNELNLLRGKMAAVLAIAES